MVIYVLVLLISNIVTSVILKVFCEIVLYRVSRSGFDRHVSVRSRENREIPGCV